MRPRRGNDGGNAPGEVEARLDLCLFRARAVLRFVRRLEYAVVPSTPPRCFARVYSCGYNRNARQPAAWSLATGSALDCVRVRPFASNSIALDTGDASRLFRVVTYSRDTPMHRLHANSSEIV
eukprot:2466661-Prymnesium_polylepis.1